MRRARHRRLRRRCRSTRGPPAVRRRRTRTAAASRRVLSYLRDEPDGQRLRPTDRGRRSRSSTWRDGEVLEVQSTTASCRCRPTRAPTSPPTTRRCATDLRRSRSCSPTGPSFTVDGNLVTLAAVVAAGRRWTRTKGSCCTPSATRTAAACGRSCTAPSISEMVVPYGDPGPLHGWKNAFDAGEWGLGRMANSLTLGCDCLGEIHYLDAVLADRARRAVHASPTPSACTRRTTGSSGSTRTCTAARPRCGARAGSWSASIATVGNYEYGFYWYFYLDGVDPARGEAHRDHVDAWRRPGDGRAVARNVDRAGTGGAAPPASVLRPARLRRRRAASTRCTRSTSSPMPAGRRATRGATRSARTRRGSTPSATRSGSSTRRAAGRGRSSTRRAQRARAAGRATSSCPGRRRRCSPHPTSIGRPSRRVRHPQPVGHARTRRRAARGGRLPQPARRWRRAARVDGGRPSARRHRRRALVHVRRHPRRPPEDWPVMPVEYAGFQLVPVGFFDRNPALDVPAPAHCSSAGGSSDASVGGGGIRWRMTSRARRCS